MSITKKINSAKCDEQLTSTESSRLGCRHALCQASFSSTLVGRRRSIGVCDVVSHDLVSVFGPCHRKPSGSKRSPESEAGGRALRPKQSVVSNNIRQVARQSRDLKLLMETRSRPVELTCVTHMQGPRILRVAKGGSGGAAVPAPLFVFRVPDNHPYRNKLKLSLDSFKP